MKFSIVRSGGKQYVVTLESELVIDALKAKEGEEIELEVLAQGDDETGEITLGKPTLEKKVKAKVVETGKGEKIRVARFKAKSRYRKVTGFRPQLTKVKIISL